MDAWSEANTPSQHDVYIGVWTNWSRGRILGSTLTLTQRDGNLVVAFAAFFVTLVATRVWKTICFFAHRQLSTSTSQDTLHHQRQVLLRNSSSPQSGLWNFLQLVWVSRTTFSSQRGHTYSTFLLMLLAIACLSTFTVVTYFIPSISSSLRDEVLLRPGYCGILEAGRTAVENFTEFDRFIGPYSIEQVANSANYAQQCYSNSPTSGSLDCTGFVVDRIPSTVNNTADCPFSSDNICRSNQNNLFISTGLLDTNDVFGINSPPDERVLFRSSLHCSPLTTEGHTSNIQYTTGNFTRYHYGSTLGQGIFEVEDLETQYLLNKEQTSKYPIKWNSYQLVVLWADMYNGSLVPGSTFLPSTNIRRYDADTILVFLSGNGVRFSQPTGDDWYRATRPLDKVQDVRANASAIFYGFEDAASPLGCVQQFQFCHTSLPENSRCGPLTSLFDSIEGALAIADSNKTKTQLSWASYQIAFNSQIIDPIILLGSQSLASHRGLTCGFQGPIASNQWQLDVIHWWATYLSRLQSAFVNGVVGPTDVRLQRNTKTQFSPDQDDATYQNICQNQKIRDSAYTNLSMFGICFLFLIGGLVISISFAIEPIFSCLHSRRKYQDQDYAYLEWVTNSSLQLHRLAQEELGWGTWSGATSDVPTTQMGERLACLDLTKPNHPRLCPPFTASEGDNKDTEDSELYANAPTSQTVEKQEHNDKIMLDESDSETVTESLSKHDHAE